MYNLIKSFGKKAKAVAKKPLFKKTLMLVVVAVCAISPAFATGADTMQQQLGGIGNTFANYVQPVQKIVYALAAICAMIGAFTIYFKMSNGDQDVKKTIMLTVGGCVGLVTLAATLPKLFGVDNISETVTFGV